MTPLEKGFSQLEISPFIYTQEIKANHISPIIQKYFRTITKSIYIFEKNPIEYPFFIGKNKLLFYLLPDILKKLPLKEKDQKDLKNLEKLSAISNDPYFLESYQAVRSKSSVEIFTKFKEKLSELPRQMKSGKKRAQEIFNYVMHSNSVIETWEKTSTISSIACFILLQESPPILDLLHMMYLVYQTPLDANVLKLKTLEKTLQKKFPDQTENIALLSSKAHFLEMFELFALETLSRLENPLPFSKLPTLLEGKMNVEDLKEAKTGWRKSIKQNPLFDIWMKDSTDRKTYQQVLDAERDHLKKSSNSITNILPGD